VLNYTIQGLHYTYLGESTDERQETGKQLGDLGAGLYRLPEEDEGCCSHPGVGHPQNRALLVLVRIGATQTNPKLYAHHRSHS
jgi:hypothetical protein